MDARQKAAFLREVAANLREWGTPADEAAREAALMLGRVEKRLEWLRGRFDRMLELHDALTIFWGDFFDRHPDVDSEDPDYPFPVPIEQGLLDRVEAEIAAARDDRWPRHLHFPAV